MPRGQVANKRLGPFAPIGSSVSCRPWRTFSQNLFSFWKRKFDSLDFYCPLSEGKWGGDFVSKVYRCVCVSLCGGYVRVCPVERKSTLRNFFFCFFFGQQMRSIEGSSSLVICFSNSRLCEICSTAASRFGASAFRKTKQIRLPGISNPLSFFFFLFLFYFLAPGKRWNFKCITIRRGGWCAAAIAVDVSAGYVYSKGRWLTARSLSSLYRQPVENDALCQISFFFFRNGTDASWKLPAVALRWLSPSCSQREQGNFVSFRFDCNLFLLLSLFIRRFFLLAVCTIPPHEEEEESRGKLNV